MSKFYVFLWLKWVFRILLCSATLAVLTSLAITIFVYISNGTPLLSSEISSAIFDLFFFWFSVIWNLTLLLALFRSVKYIFNRCIYGYELKLRECDYSKNIEIIGYGDLVKVWRKWFMLLIWLSVVQMIFATLILYIFSSSENIYTWFDIKLLVSFIMISGYFSFILLPSRCKRVKVIKC